MLKRTTFVVLVLFMMGLAGCGGDEPAPTPTPLATFTPTPEPPAEPTQAPAETPVPAATEAPAEAATEAPTEAATEAAAEVPAAPTAASGEGITDTGSVTDTLPAGDAFASPLAAPQSPLAVPPAPQAEATPSGPVTGSWELQAIAPSPAAEPTLAQPGYRLAFGRTGVVRVMADCKPGRGAFVRGDDGTLALDIVFSDVRCAPESLAEPFAQALSEVTGYRREGDRLSLVYGTQGSEMILGRVSQVAAFGVPFLSWSNLKNSTFLVPSVPAGDGQAVLVEGEFRSLASPAPGGAEAQAGGAQAEYVVSLATMHTYGELDPETPTPEPTVTATVTGTGTVTETSAATPTPTPTPEPQVAYDTVVVLVVEDGRTLTGTEAVTGSVSPESFLVPVLNSGGLAIPLQLEPLGANVFVRDLRWDGEQLTADYDVGAEGRRRVYTYTVGSAGLSLVSEDVLPPLPPKARLDLPAQGVVVSASDESAGEQTASLTGEIQAGVVHSYRLGAQAGQQLSVTLQSPFDDVWLSLYGADDQTVLRSIRSETGSWAGVVPAAQEYVISAVASGSTSAYTLTVQLGGEGQPSVDAQGVQTPTEPTTGTAAEGQAVHIVIDGAPSAAVLDVLQRNNATADIFVTGTQGAQAPEALAAAGAAGHGIGVVAGPISALTSGGRDRLFAEISATRQALGAVASNCVRPPRGATDGYSRAAAAELGYEILLWDIDAGSTAADALAGQVFPGAVIRFADTGDGGQAATSTLESLLPLLSQGGYSVRSLCR